MTYVRIMWMLSMMGFLVVLLYMHVYLPDLLQLDAQGDGMADYTFGKNLLFYGSIAVLVIINGSLLAFSKIFTFLPVQAIPVPRRDYWTTDSYMRGRMEKNFRSWMKGLMLVINMLLMIFLLNLYSMCAAIPIFRVNFKSRDIFCFCSLCYSLSVFRVRVSRLKL